MNKVMLIGNVGKEPDVRYYDADKAVVRLTLATSERSYTLQNGTQVPERTDWHNIVLFGGLAKVAEKYVHKGDKLYIEGRLRYSTYDDQKGQRRYLTEVYAENMELLTMKQKPVSDTATNVHTSESPLSDSVDNDSNLPF